MNNMEEWRKYLDTGDEASKEVWKTVLTVPERDWALPPGVVKRPDGGYETVEVLKDAEEVKAMRLLNLFAAIGVLTAQLDKHREEIKKITQEADCPK